MLSTLFFQSEGYADHKITITPAILGRGLAIFALRTAGGYYLPSFEINGASCSLRKISEQLEHSFGVKARSLCIVSKQTNALAKTVRIFMLMEALGSECNSNGVWVAINKGVLDPYASANELDAFNRAVREIQENNFPPRGQPWFGPGWQLNAEVWINDQMASLGYQITAPIEEIRKWSLSCVLKVPTNDGGFFFKAAGPTNYFANEAIVTKGLAEMFPGRAPTPVAVDTVRNWMIISDFGRFNRWRVSNRHLVSMLATFASIQREAVDRLPELERLGLVYHTLENLEKRIDEIIYQICKLGPLSAVEGARLQSSTPLLKSMCKNLAQHRIPNTLLHGDLHGGNVAIRTVGDREEFMFFDWADSCVGHPFLDLIVLFSEITPAERGQLAEAYLKSWIDFEPIETLREALRSALFLIPIFQLAGYRHLEEQIFEYSDANCIASAVSFWIKRLVEVNSTAISFS